MSKMKIQKKEKCNKIKISMEGIIHAHETSEKNVFLNIYIFLNELPLISNQNEKYLFLCKKILWILYPHLTTVLLVNLESEKCIESEK